MARTTPTALGIVSRTGALIAFLLAARAYAADPAGCADIGERIEARFRIARQGCLVRALRREARGLTADTAACEAKRLTRVRQLLMKAGCDDGAEDPSAEQAVPSGGAGGTALVSLAGAVAEVRYDVVGDLAITEGDIVLGTIDEVVARDRELRRSGIRSGTRAGASDFSWPGLVVPFEISSTLSDALQDRIQSAIDHWNANTVFRLRARNGESDFVRFVSGDGCSSPVGRQGGRQNVNLSENCGRGSIIHEIGHSIGLFHEQSRNDRDVVIIVQLENVEDGKEHNFDTFGAGGRERGPFDFNSIMLYGSFAFSSNGEPTMTKLDGSTFVGQRNGLSTADIAGATQMAVNMESAFTLKDKLRNQLSNRCLDVDGGSRASQATIENADCAGNTRQRWHFFRHPPTGRQLLVNEKSGLCLDVPGGATTVNLDLQQFPCHGGRSQAFTDFGRFFPTDPILLQNSASQLCVAVESTANGGDVEQRTCDTSSSRQKWFRELF
jgi:hypothetical protein